MQTQTPLKPLARMERTAAGRMIETARRRVDAERPFSPEWDAAMSALEDAERELWRLDHQDDRPAA